VSSSNDPPQSGQVQFSNNDFSTSPMTVKISKVDTDGTGHTFATADAGTWIEFVEDDEDYCLGQITVIDNDDDDFFLATFVPSVAKGVAHDDNNIKIRLFEASDDFDATGLMPKAGGTFTGTVKHKKEILIEPTLPETFVNIKNRYTTNADGTSTGDNANGTGFGINFDLDHGNSGYNQVKWTTRNGDILNISGGTGAGAKYTGKMTDDKHLVNKGFIVPKTGGEFTGDVEIDTSGESNDIEAGFTLKGNRPSTANSAATIKFDNEQSTEKGYLTYRSYGAGTWFAFNQDLDLNNNGLHSVGRIRMEPDSGIGSGNNTRLTFHNASTGQEGEGLLVVPRPSNDRRSFSIRGNDVDGLEVDMLYTYTNPTGTPDAANYVGKIDSPKNLVNKGYVDSKAQSSSKSPVMMHSGSSVGGRTYNYVDPGSINEYQFSANSSNASGDTLYMFRAWSQKYGWTQVLDYDCTEDTTIEMWQHNTNSDPLLIMRSGIREIVESQYSRHDAKILLNRFWIKPDYKFSKFNGYTFMINGLVERPASLVATVDLDNDEEYMRKTKGR